MKKTELTPEEVDLLCVMLHMMGFREKREFPSSLQRGRTDMQRKMGKILKKLRKGKQFISY